MNKCQCKKSKLLYHIKAYTYSSPDAPSNYVQLYEPSPEPSPPVSDKPTTKFFTGFGAFFDRVTGEKIGYGSLLSTDWKVEETSGETSYIQGVQTITLTATHFRPQILIPLFTIVSPSLTKTQFIYTQDVNGKLTTMSVVNDVPNDTEFTRQDVDIKIYNLPFYPQPI